jgi:SAM-dependent methyltransferase
MYFGFFAPIELEERLHGLEDLAEVLADSGLGELLTSFNPLHPRPVYWTGFRQRVPDRLKGLLDLFGLGREIDIRALPDGLDWIAAELPRHGVGIAANGKLQLKQGLRLLPFAGRWLFCTPPGAGLKYYLGDDSIALMLRTQMTAGGDVLDLCAGTGLQALHCAGFASRITAVERDREAAEIARINVMLNRLEDRVEVLHGDMFEPVKGRQFDLVVANPPLLPVPDNLPELSIGHGGHDGMRICCRILEGLPMALTPGGRAHLIASCLTDAGNRSLRRLLVNLANTCQLDIIVTIISMQEMARDGRYLDAMAHAVAREIAADPDHVLAAYQNDMRERKATHLSFLFLLVRHGTGTVEMSDLRTPASQSLWHIDL